MHRYLPSALVKYLHIELHNFVKVYWRRKIIYDRKYTSARNLARSCEVMLKQISFKNYPDRFISTPIKITIICGVGSNHKEFCYRKKVSIKWLIYSCQLLMEMEVASLTWNRLGVLHDGGGQCLWQAGAGSSKCISPTWGSQRDF